MVLPGHNRLMVSEECLAKNFMNGLKLTRFNGSTVEVRGFHPIFYMVGYY